MALHVIIVGMPGAGKTVVGSRLAQLWNVDFADADSLIVESDGRTVPQIFIDDGEAGFREIEAQVIRNAIETREGVLSLGGGAILNRGTRQLLLEQNVVLLDAHDLVLVDRVTREPIRPLLQNDPLGGIERLRRERADLYREVANYVVDSSEIGVNEVADTIIAMMNEQGNE